MRPLPVRCPSSGRCGSAAASSSDTPVLPTDRTLGAPMLYTSGTTGRPKGVRRPLTGASTDQVTVPNYYFFAGFGIEGADNVHICGSPLYHTAVLNFVTISLNLGQLVVLMGAVVLLTGQGLVINRLAGIDYPLWRAPAPLDP